MLESADYFRKQAEKCRRLAASSLDQRVAATLRFMAEEYEQKAKSIEEEAAQ